MKWFDVWSAAADLATQYRTQIGYAVIVAAGGNASAARRIEDTAESIRRACIDALTPHVAPADADWLATAIPDAPDKGAIRFTRPGDRPRSVRLYAYSVSN